MNGGYYTDKDGRKVLFDDVGAAIRRLHPNLIGAHIFQLLDALGLRDGFDKGHSPYALPYTFTETN